MSPDGIRELEEAAKAGNPEAQYRLGCYLHDEAPDAQRDLARSIALLNESSRRGNARAARRLGYIWIEQHDPGRAREHYASAAAAGDVLSQLSLGAILRKRVLPWSRHGEPNPIYMPVEAVTWLRKAAEAGEVVAAIELGLELLTKDSPVGNPVAGALMLEEASTRAFVRVFTGVMEASDEQALVPTVMCALPGDDQEFPFAPRSIRFMPSASAEELQSAARAGVAEAMHDLGAMCFFDPTSAYARPPFGDGRAVRSALAHYEQAAMRGNVESQFAAGCMYVVEVGLKSMRMALPLLTDAVNGGHEEAGPALEWLDRNMRLRIDVL